MPARCSTGGVLRGAYGQFSWVRLAKFQIESLESHIQIHRITCGADVNPTLFSGKVCMQGFNAPGVRKTDYDLNQTFLSARIQSPRNLRGFQGATSVASSILSRRWKTLSHPQYRPRDLWSGRSFMNICAGLREWIFQLLLAFLLLVLLLYIMIVIVIVIIIVIIMFVIIIIVIWNH